MAFDTRRRLVLIALLAAATLSLPPLALAQSDNQIVPRVRIGPVRLGMTDAELYNSLGNPTTTTPWHDSTSYYYSNIGLSVTVSNNRRTVIRVDTSDSRYSMASGLKPGSGALELSVKLGSHAGCNSSLGLSGCAYGYEGLVLQLNNDGSVRDIAVVNN